MTGTIVLVTRHFLTTKALQNHSSIKLLPKGPSVNLLGIMHFMSLFYSAILSLNTFEKSNIIENIGRHKRVDQTWVVNDNEASFLNRRYPLIINDYVLQKLNENFNVSSSHVKRSIRRGLIFINGRKATNEWNVQIGDTVQLVSQYSVAPFSGHNSSTGYLSNVLIV